MRYNNSMNKSYQKIIAGCGIVTILLSSSIITAISQQNSSQPTQNTRSSSVVESQGTNKGESGSSSEPNSTKKPAIETKTETKTKDLPFETKYIDDNTLAKGTTKVTQTGAKGIETTTYTVTYTDGKETAREVAKVEVTKKPINHCSRHLRSTETCDHPELRQRNLR